MKRFHKEQGPLPLTLEVAHQLSAAIKEARLSLFMQAHESLTPAHFLIPNPDVDGPEDRGWTPLHDAAKDREALRLLADSPFSPLRDGARFSAADFLTQTGASARPIHAAAVHGNLARVAALLPAGQQGFTMEQLLATSITGRTVLHYTGSSLGDYASCAAVLRAVGEGFSAAPFLQPCRMFKRTALHEAEQHCHLESLFAPELWAGGVAEMAELARHVSEEGRQQSDLDRLLHAAALLSRRRVSPELFRAAARAEMPLPTAQGREREGR